MTVLRTPEQCFENLSGYDFEPHYLVPGCAGQPHATLHGGHFIQQEDGERWSAIIIEWMKSA